MRKFSSLHDPKNEKYAIYYSVVLIAVIITITLLVNGIFQISPIEATMMFFEGFVALFMLSRHEKVSHSFSNHLKKSNEKIKNLKINIVNGIKKSSRISARIQFRTKSIPSFNE